jgi:multiple sugar transport system substrate-binding protein
MFAKEMGMTFKSSWFTFDGTRDKLVIDFRGKIPNWDIIYVDSKWVSEFAELGLMVAIEDYYKDSSLADPNFDFGDFLQSQVDVYTYKNKVWAIPLISNAIALAYREDIFNNAEEKAAFKKRYGYDLKVPENYTKEFMDVAEFFTRKKGEKLAGQVLDSDFYGTVHSNKKGGFLYHDYISYMVAFGADVIFDPKTMKPTWNSPENIACGKFYQKLTQYQPSEHINMTSGEATSLFANGKAFMQVEFIPRLSGMIPPSPVGDKVQYALPPTERSDRPHAFLVAPNALGIYGLSKNKKAAYKLMEKVFSKENVKTMSIKEDGYQPPRLSVLTDDEYKTVRPVQAFYMNLVANTKVHTFPHPMIDNYHKMMDIASTSVSQVLSGERSVEDAYNDAQKQLEAVFKELDL